jgi:hypothetical protein
VNGRPTPIEFELGDATGRGENRLCCTAFSGWLTILLTFAGKTCLQAQKQGAQTMELLAILLLGGILLGTEVWLHVRRQRVYAQLTSDIVSSLGPSIATLDPDNRYILSLPDSLTEGEFDAAVEAMRKSLGLENANIHIVIVHGNVTMVEFS